MNPSRRPTPRAFTLLEIIVAIGAVAVISLGLAAVFDAVGKTVATGRRVSRLSQYARLMEATLRADFRNLSRDGFLAIRQQNCDVDDNGVADPALPAPNPDAVALSSEDVQPRLRRIDEIIFFTRGQFHSTRPPISPGWSPRAGEARIYYGHGQRGNPGDLVSVNFRVDNVAERLGHQDATDPNKFAANWTLLRHETLLAREAGAEDLPLSPVFDLDPTTAPSAALVLRDKDMQVRGQPAAPGIFRSINRAIFFGSPDSYPYLANQHAWHATFSVPGIGGATATINNLDGITGLQAPQFSSGVIDVATTDLAEVRAFVTGFNPDAGVDGLPIAFGQLGIPQSWRSLGAAAQATSTLPSPPTPADNAQAWMENAFPTASQLRAGYPNATWLEVPAIDPAGARMRYEPEAPGLVGIASVTLAPNDTAGERARSYLLADTRSLQANNFLPACSEFVVEWSFGDTDASGSVVWHGPPRPEDAAATTFAPVYHYPGATDPTTGAVTPNGREVAQLPGGTVVPDFGMGGGVPSWPVDPRLIYGYDPAPTDACVVAHFGYTDPTYFPPADPTIASPDHNNQLWPDDVQSMPWPWPRMIRVRITLADPLDPRPETESTFEYIFELPGTTPPA